MVYYECCQVSLRDLHDYRVIDVTWRDQAVRRVATFRFTLPKKALLSDLESGLQSRLKSRSITCQRSRFFEVWRHRIVKQYDRHVSLEQFNNGTELIAEQLTQDSTPDHVTVHVIHFTRTGSQLELFGEPFYLTYHAVSNGNCLTRVTHQPSERYPGRDQATTAKTTANQ